MFLGLYEVLSFDKWQCPGGDGMWKWRFVLARLEGVRLEEFEMRTEAANVAIAAGDHRKRAAGEKRDEKRTSTTGSVRHLAVMTKAGDGETWLRVTAYFRKHGGWVPAREVTKEGSPPPAATSSRE